MHKVWTVENLHYSWEQHASKIFAQNHRAQSSSCYLYASLHLGYLQESKSPLSWRYPRCRLGCRCQPSRNGWIFQELELLLYFPCIQNCTSIILAGITLFHVICPQNSQDNAGRQFLSPPFYPFVSQQMCLVKWLLKHFLKLFLHPSPEGWNNFFYSCRVRHGKSHYPVPAGPLLLWEPPEKMPFNPL